MVQSLCWAYSTDWTDFPAASRSCLATDPGFLSRLDTDDFAFITHSLGSRIMIDALQTMARDIDRVAGSQAAGAQFKRKLQDQSTTVFMLANQLPLLQSGFRPRPSAAKCRPTAGLGAMHYADRLFKNVDIVAFSDPNGIGRVHPIPDRFVQDYLDSLAVPDCRNITLNVAHVRSLFGLGELADPMRAHLDYETDVRVIALIVGGLGQPSSRPMVGERCEWIQTSEDLR